MFYFSIITFTDIPVTACDHVLIFFSSENYDFKSGTPLIFNFMESWAINAFYVRN